MPLLAKRPVWAMIYQAALAIMPHTLQRSRAMSAGSIFQRTSVHLC